MGALGLSLSLPFSELLILHNGSLGSETYLSLTGKSASQLASILASCYFFIVIVVVILIAVLYWECSKQPN